MGEAERMNAALLKQENLAMRAHISKLEGALRNAQNIEQFAQTAMIFGAAYIKAREGSDGIAFCVRKGIDAAEEFYRQMGEKLSTKEDGPAQSGNSDAELQDKAQAADQMQGTPSAD